MGDAFTAHVCYESCGYQYWTLQVCPHCKRPEVTVFLNKPNFGQRIQCANCGHGMYYFRCPNENCLELYFKDEHYYRMGSNVQCVSCEQAYKVITCVCGGTNVLGEGETVFEGFSMFRCKCCAKEFTFTVCPACAAPEFHIDKLDIGDRIRCSACKAWRKYVPCPKCGKTLRGDRFSFCEPNKCFECGVVFEYSRCPYGCAGLNYNILEKPLGPARSCFDCGRGYAVLNCRKCQQSLYLEKLDKSVGVVDLCPHCKTAMKYYLCGACGALSEGQTACANQGCPPPKSLTDNTVRQKAAERGGREGEGAEGEGAEECKICFSNKVEVINETCSHLMMCSECLRGCQQRSKGTNVPCPVCKAIGRYFVYKKPIYS